MSDDSSGYPFILALAAIAGAFYMIPTMVAFARGHPNRWLIMVINVAFGGTVIGWLGPLVWAFNRVHRSEHGSHGGESGVNLFVNDPISIRLPDTITEVGEQLMRLKRLRDEGAIDEQEYQLSRKPLVDRLSKL